MLTACGIETLMQPFVQIPLLVVATVLTACGIETLLSQEITAGSFWVATVLTACGIETLLLFRESLHEFCLIVTVLTACGMRRRVRGSRGAKRRWGPHISSPWPKGRENKGDEVTVLTACGIETPYLYGGITTGFVRSNSTYRLRYWNATLEAALAKSLDFNSCNSAYRLQYATKGARQQRSKATMRSAHL